MTRAGYTPPRQEPVRAPEPPRKPKKKKKRRRMSGAAIVSLAVFLLAAAIGAGTIHVYLYISPYQQTFVPGTMLMGHSLEGMTRESAQELLDSLEKTHVDTWHFDITCMDRTYTLTAEDAQIAVNAAQTLDVLWTPGHEGGMLERYRAMRALVKEPLVFPRPMMTDEVDAAVRGLLKRIRADMECAPVDATVSFTPGRAAPFAFTDEQAGRALAVDEDDLVFAVWQSMDMLTPGSLALEPEAIEPQVYRAVLESSISLRARVVAEVTGGEAAVNNVRLAAQALRGLRVNSGETLSFNEAVGSRTQESGYLAAPEPAYGADVSGADVSGVGGGVCQVSTALYRAALLSCVDVRERHAAARPVAYCDMGQEAAVSDQGLDLVLYNQTDAPLFIDARVYEDDGAVYLEVTLIGEELGKRLRLNSLIDETGTIEEPVYVRDREGQYATYTDERVPVGEALAGYAVSVERVTLDEGGQETAAEIVSESVYEAVAPTVYVGVQQRDAQ